MRSVLKMILLTRFRVTTLQILRKCSSHYHQYFDVIKRIDCKTTSLESKVFFQIFLKRFDLQHTKQTTNLYVQQRDPHLLLLAEECWECFSAEKQRDTSEAVFLVCQLLMQHNLSQAI